MAKLHPQTTLNTGRQNSSSSTTTTTRLWVDFLHPTTTTTKLWVDFLHPTTTTTTHQCDGLRPDIKDPEWYKLLQRQRNNFKDNTTTKLDSGGSKQTQYFTSTLNWLRGFISMAPPSSTLQHSFPALYSLLSQLSFRSFCRGRSSQIYSSLPLLYYLSEFNYPDPLMLAPPTLSSNLVTPCCPSTQLSLQSFCRGPTVTSTPFTLLLSLLMLAPPTLSSVLFTPNSLPRS
jgi:hypothetical protein